MIAVAEPNWFIILGLMYTFFGLGQIIGVATVRPPTSSLISEIEQRAAQRSVRGSFAALLLAIGFSQFLLGQFLSIPMGAYATIMTLTLAMIALVFSLVGDSWADAIATPSIVSSLEKEASTPVVQVPVAAVHQIEGKRRVDLVRTAP